MNSPNLLTPGDPRCVCEKVGNLRGKRGLRLPFWHSAWLAESTQKAHLPNCSCKLFRRHPRREKQVKDGVFEGVPF